MERLIEINKKKSKAGRTPIKIVLHEIHSSPDQYNERGISWNRQYTEDNKDSVAGMPLICQFLDDEQTIPFGEHGDYVIKDNEVYFENSPVVGAFEDAYIDDNVTIGDKTISALIGLGYIFDQRYPSVVEFIQGEIADGHQVKTSVEIFRDKSQGLKSIVYDGGYKEKGRVPKFYQYSGSAFCIGVKPADDSAIMLELNSAINQRNESEEKHIMDEKMLTDFVKDIKHTLIETNAKNSEYETQIEALNSTIIETNATVEELRATIATVEKERDENWKKSEEYYKELEILREEVAKAKIKERIGELNSALAEFSDEEKAFAKDEIVAFEADPTTIEINSIVDKIYTEVGKKAKEAAKISETNAAKGREDTKFDDIFADVLETNASQSSDEDESIF